VFFEIVVAELKCGNKKKEKERGGTENKHTSAIVVQFLSHNSRTSRLSLRRLVRGSCSATVLTDPQRPWSAWRSSRAGWGSLPEGEDVRCRHVRWMPTRVNILYIDILNKRKPKGTHGSRRHLSKVEEFVVTPYHNLIVPSSIRHQVMR